MCRCCACSNLRLNCLMHSEHSLSTCKGMWHGASGKLGQLARNLHKLLAWQVKSCTSQHVLMMSLDSGRTPSPTSALAHLSFRQRQQSFCSHCPPAYLPPSLSDLSSSIFLGNLPGSTLGAFVLDTRCLSQIVAGLVARLMLPRSPSLLAFPLHFVAICWSIVDTFWGRS